ncbi:Methyltransferase FkbM domain-containing protein [Yoonia rosea]|uniref:Methyltransferase FkbM domain-containing protein n=1 Tax=Yoonia rosea TaxID=287098 RepID=A0A1R3WPE9_9RHOB|nr:FkbM family methyltransferase [Yoonia rosea]SIT78493.1 Methyltransferase FkbM domain-containing protein [Yoonia rosea]
MTENRFARTALPEAAVVDDFLRPYATDTPLIRVGDFGDGGYLVPDDFRGIAACYSPGVSQQASFEMDMAKRRIPSFMADASVANPPLQVPGAQFIPKFLGDKDEGDFITLASWVAATDPNPDADLLLQMDIEGAEYETLGAAPRDLLRRFRIIVIELHHLPSILTKPKFLNRALSAINKLHDDFVTVHLHPNNVSGTVEIEGEMIPRVIEATLLRRDRAQGLRPVQSLPHPLDVRHNLRKPALALPDRWMGAAERGAEV